MRKSLSDVAARTIQPGSSPVAVGGVDGLRLFPGKVRGQGRFELRFTSPKTGKRRDMGLGTYPETSLADARRTALDARKTIAQELDPIEERRTWRQNEIIDSSAPTFEVAARQVYAEYSPGYKNPIHKSQWITSLENYVFPAIGSRQVSELTARDFARVLRSIWLDKVETATRVRQRCYRIMDWCTANEYTAGNPVGVVDKLLPKQPRKSDIVQHHPALPWRDIPEFFAKLVSNIRRSQSRRLLTFLILTGARSGEARGMLWDELELKNNSWVLPPERMKTGRPHRIALSKMALEVLALQEDFYEGNDLVFPSNRGGPLSGTSLSKLLLETRSDVPGRRATTHGMRSTFRDWASENDYPRDYAERALSHAISNRTEAAYHRTDQLDQRRSMMEDWGEFCFSEVPPNWNSL